MTYLNSKNDKFSLLNLLSPKLKLKTHYISSMCSLIFYEILSINWNMKHQKTRRASKKSFKS
jgi:hypothetical protein